MPRLLPAIEKDASIRDALVEMKRHKLYHLLVLDGDSVVGVFSSVDALRTLASKLEAAGDVERADAVRSFFEERVGSVSSRPVIVVEEDVSLRDAARIMHYHGVGCLPVVRGEQITSAICENDIVDALIATGLHDPVYRFATRRVVYVDIDSLVMEAIGVMAEGGFRRLPVLARGAIAGLTTVNVIMERLVEEPRLLYETVREVMVEAPVVNLFTPLVEALGAMKKGGLGAVLLEHGGTLSGIFTERDAVRVYAIGA